MTFLVLTTLLYRDDARTPILWRDPSKTLVLERKALPKKLRYLVDAPSSTDGQLLAMLQSDPADWMVNAVVRYRIERDRDLALADQAVYIVHLASMQFAAKSPRWQACAAYTYGLGDWLAECQKEGLFKVETERTKFSFVLSPYWQWPPSADMLRNEDDAYEVLDSDIHWIDGSARALWRDCVKRFGYTPGLCVYGARAFSMGKLGTMVQVGSGPRVNHPELDLMPDDAMASRLAKMAWQKAPEEPGVMARVVRILTIIRDPQAPKALREYARLDDDPSRQEQTRTLYRKFFKE